MRPGPRSGLLRAATVTAESDASSPVLTPLERIRAAQRAQRSKSVYATSYTVMLAQVLFAAFVFGHSQGPVRPQPAEVGAGMAATLLGSLLVAPWFARRKQREGAAWAGRVHEGSHRRSLLVFDDVFILGGEVVPYDQVERWELADEEGGIKLRYQDLEHGGPVIRDLVGPSSAFRRLVRRAETQRTSS